MKVRGLLMLENLSFAKNGGLHKNMPQCFMKSKYITSILLKFLFFSFPGKILETIDTGSNPCHILFLKGVILKSF